MITITGAGGLLGRTLVKKLKEAKTDIKAVYKKDLDLNNRRQVNKFLNQLKTDIIINCAAITDVDACEIDRRLAKRVNADAVAELSSYPCVFMQISSDFILASNSTVHPLNDFDLCNDKYRPVNWYGRMKMRAERFTKLNPHHYIIRTSSIYGECGKTFLSKLPDLLKNNQPVKALSDIEITPNYTGDVADFIITTLSKNFGVYHASNAFTITPLEIALQMKAYMKSKSEITPISIKDLNLKAERPTNIKLIPSDNYKYNWQDSLHLFLDGIINQTNTTSKN